ncbi:ankyrin repeat domain-containing protein [Wolbachia endosymbiont (group A) of Barypeithes pellucidus]|uniref:ankyrin repeat domain-containing protein n=1 Tax=Wolbachia endosymbiont (group A) of Barypeithes pellucidus TaxID=3139322 RepID=UPI003CCAE4F0
MHGGVPNKESNEELRNILGQLASNSNLLDPPNNIQHIMLLLGAGADPNIQNQNGKTLSYYLDEKLRDILNELASNSNLLNNYAYHIKSLLEAGADPNTRNQDKRTLLHYAAKNNCLQAIELLLKKGADKNMQDQDGKTPFEYVTEHNCLQAIKNWSYGSDNFRKNEGNATDEGYGSGDDNQTVPTKDKGNLTNNSSNYPKKHNDDQALRDDTGYSSGDDNQIISTEPSDCDPEDEDSSCSSSDYLFLEDSLLAKLEIPLTTDEQELIDKFCEKIRGITAQNKQESEENILESIEKIVDEYLKEGLRLNSSWSNGNEKGDKETVTSLIFKEMEEVIAQLRVNPRSSTAMLNTHDYTDESDGDEYKASDIIIKRITSNLLLKGGMGQEFLSGDTELTNKHYDFDYLDDLNKQCKDRKEELISIAYEGIVNKSKQTHEYDFKAEIDNRYFYVKYSQDSIIEPVKILNNEKAKELKLKVGILQIGESIVRVEGTKDGKRNCTDVLKGSIKMSFTTEVGEINIYLSPSKEGGNKIEVEIDDESEARLNKLKAEKKSLGKNCLLGGKNVLEATKDKGFKKNGNVPTESIETTKDVPFTDFTQACSQQIDTSVKGR